MRVRTFKLSLLLLALLPLVGLPVVSVAADGAKGDTRSAKQHSIDKATQDAMVEIRDLVANNHSLITHRRMPKLTAIKMSSRVVALIEKIRDVSTLKDDARMELSYILADLERGVKAIGGSNKMIGAIDGIVLMDEALAQYANQFDHPGWKAPREL